MLKDIENYYNGAKAYLLFLRSELSGKDEYKNFILEKNYQIGAVLANLSNLLLATKEDIVENEGELVYSSKVFDACLIKSINLIGTIEEDGIKIDNHLFKDKEALVATIRNKIAHGDFQIDFENNMVVLNIREDKVRIDIDHLASFTVSAFSSTIKDYKGTSYKRNLLSFNLKGEKRTKPLKTISEFRNVIKSFSNKTFEIKSNDGLEIDKECRDLLEYFLKLYKEAPKKAMDNPIYQEMHKYLKQKNCTLSIREERIKDPGLLEYLEEYAKTYILGKDFTYDDQIKLVGLEISKYFDAKNYKFDNAMAYTKNLIMLSIIKKINAVDHKKISEKMVKSGYNNLTVSYNELGSAIINMFTSLFIYPFETFYRPTKEYDKDKKDLDFGRLDTSLFRVDTLIINDNPLKEMKAKCDSCIERAEFLEKTIAKHNEDLENVKKKGNQKAITTIESMLQKLTTDLDNIKEFASETKKEYNLMQTDYTNNVNFFRNEAIINGIRDSIAHGNYEIVSNPEPIIMFKDVYDGELKFKAYITLADFYNFIDSNSKIVLDFIKEKEERTI